MKFVRCSTAKMEPWAESAQFFIVSGPPAAGKTTFLEHCASKMQQAGLRVGGLVVPVVNGRRCLRLFSKEEFRPFQLNNANPGDGCDASKLSDTVAGTRVGNFVFSQDGFAAARSELVYLRDSGSSLTGQRTDWILIDEIGPLEFRGDGLEPALGKLLQAACLGKLGSPRPRFLMIVRPSLTEEVIKAYNLDGPGLKLGQSLAEAQSASLKESPTSLIHIDIPALDDLDKHICQLVRLPRLL